MALLALTLGVTGVAAQAAPDAAMPKSVKRFTDTRSDCFLPDERQDYDAWIDQFRMAVPGCDKGMIPPQKTVQSFRVYKEGSNRVIDCSTLRKKEFGTRFLDTYLGDVVGEARNAPICAANMLYAWAKGDSLTELGEQGNEAQGQAMIGWTLGGLSAAYFAHPAVRDAAKSIPTADGKTADAVIVGWFHKLAGPVSAKIDAERAAKNEDNLQYWRAYAILPTAFLAQDPKLMAQSKRVFDTALGSVTTGSKNPANDGYLPLEMERGPRAMHYQSYATMPIMSVALLSKAEGCGFVDDAARRDDLVLLLSRTLEGRANPDLFAAQVARFSKKGKPIEQIRTEAVRDAPQLMYFANAINPAIFDAVNANVAAATGQANPVFKTSGGAKASYDRLGGDYASLAAAAERPGPPPAALASVCHAGG